MFSSAKYCFDLRDNVLKSSNNDSVAAGFVSWSQDKFLIKLQDTLFQMQEGLPVNSKI